MLKAVKSGLLIDSTGVEPIKKGVVLIENGKIKEVGPSDKVHIPSGTEIVDVSDQTVLAGMIETHQHLFIASSKYGHEEMAAEPPELKVLWTLRGLLEDLGTGVTTERFLGTADHAEIPLMRAIESGVFAGPRLLTAGQGLRPMGGHGYQGTMVSAGVDNVRQIIRENFSNGATCTKIFISGKYDAWPIFVNTKKPTSTFWTKEEIKAAIDESHRVGAKIAAHASEGEGVTWFIEEGGDSVEHGSGLTDEQMDLMIEKGTYLGMTLSSGHPTRGTYWELMRAKEDTDSRTLEMRRARSKAVLLKAIKKGVKWTTGQDEHYGTHPYVREYLVKEFGVSPMDAILANTKNAADCCGILDEVGTLEPGKRADLFSCKGNPLEDITALKNVGIVMVGGREYECNTHHWKDAWEFDNLWMLPYKQLGPAFTPTHILR